MFEACVEQIFDVSGAPASSLHFLRLLVLVSYSNYSLFQECLPTQVEDVDVNAPEALQGGSHIQFLKTELLQLHRKDRIRSYIPCI